MQSFLSTLNYPQIFEEFPDYNKRFIKYSYKVTWANKIAKIIGEDINFELNFNENNREFFIKATYRGQEHEWNIKYFKSQIKKYLFDFKILEDDDDIYIQKMNKMIAESKKKMVEIIKLMKIDKENYRKNLLDLKNWQENLKNKLEYYQNYKESNQKTKSKFGKNTEMETNGEESNVLQQNAANFNDEINKILNFEAIIEENSKNLYNDIKDFKNQKKKCFSIKEKFQTKEAINICRESMKIALGIVEELAKYQEFLLDPGMASEFKEIYDHIKSNSELVLSKIEDFKI